MSSNPSARPPGERTGGRRRNPQLTRRAILDALLAAVHDGDYLPTAKTIAARAGTSERSVFVHFPTREDLLIAATEQQSTSVEALVAQADAQLPLEQRVDAVVRQSAAIYALQRRPRLLGLLESQRSAAVDARMRLTDERLRAGLARIFAPELTGGDGVDEQLLDLLDATAGWPYRHHLVERCGLSEDAASAAIRRALLTLLTAQRGEGRQAGPPAVAEGHRDR
ncbi:TetR/AcrR family transcriptional regulator [Nocardia sp. CDC159]|uniref:TetR/AcrR family transcriptional regulator n=1 Tax=Nocardia pulmonis TaxID=2951408 RepID=A0A9X2EE40_9NOCA|nr:MULTISPECIES: TetR/AcrR family transcriptional regulator [Nocardia]MCM6778655.1 TetR/AcrR family transcriptional regulator [Nocardia pulmonis]MCM6791544.1 TetR/AcrR family transcriptional regulator [Nocardia sp. CDC159]